jgi:signal transduction histidine kinase/CheY-like chemotaxis protein
MPIFGFFSKIFTKKSVAVSSFLDGSDIVNQALFFKLLDLNDSVILFFTKDAGYIGANAAFCKTFGFKDISDFRKTHESVRELFLSETEEIFTENDKSWMDYIRLHKKNSHIVKVESFENKTVYFSVSNTVLKEDGQELYIVELKDVTELEAAKAKANEIESIKTTLLSNIGHEFRTPMNGILGFLELLEKSNPTSMQTDYLKMTSNSARTLLSNIEALLDLSQWQSGNLSLENKAFDLLAELDELMQFFTQTGLHKGVNVGFFVDPKIPKKVEGDLHKIQQIIYSLLQNAIEFTQAGGKVLVEIKLLKFSDKGVCSIGFSVKDNGVGIPANLLSSINKPFSISEQADQRVGIGLSLSHAFVALMGSELKIQSEQKRGTTVTFTLEFQNSSGHSFAMIPHKNVKVLLADEHRLDDANLLTNYLRSFSIGVAKANLIDEDIFEDISALYVVASQYDNGWMSRLREYTKKAPVVFLLENDELLHGAFENFVDMTLSKPLFPKSVFEHLSRLFSHDYGKTESSHGLHTGTLALVVEDNLINQRLIKILLQEYNIDVVTASNGQEAVDICNKKAFDMIFMDIDMPIKNGVMATKEIKADFLKNGHIMPIIAVTALAMDGDKERLLASGLDDYISKPLTRGKLELVLKNIYKSDEELICRA